MTTLSGNAFCQYQADQNRMRRMVEGYDSSEDDGAPSDDELEACLKCSEAPGMGMQGCNKVCRM